MFHPDDPRGNVECTWKEDPDGVWYSCDADEGGKNAFCFEDGDPQDNGFRFCPYCGKPIAIVRYTQGDEEDYYGNESELPNAE